MADDEYVPSPVCEFCIHYHHGFDYACAAFPDGIPAEIWLGENTHTEPFPGDHGICFEMAKGECHLPPWMKTKE